VALLLVAVLALGAATLAPVAATERLLTAVAVETAECRYAAEAVAGYAIATLQTLDDWTGVLAGVARPELADTTRTPAVAGSRRLDLDAIGALLPPVGPGQWGADEPQWVLYAWGPARALAPGATETGIYVAVWAADDEGDGDRDPSRDANGRLELRAEAFGPVRGRRSVRVSVVREAPAPAALRVVGWASG
jgi:hypothetical protein